MIINGTLIGIYSVCHREMWLHFNNIQMEHSSELVLEGKLIEQNSYKRRSEKFKELQFIRKHKEMILSAKIDYYDPSSNTIHEIKKSDKVEKAHIAQVKFYMYLMQKEGIDVKKAIIEYPKLRDKTEVIWESNDTEIVEYWIDEIFSILSKSECPPLVKKSICSSCSYHDFCFAGEIDD